MRSSNYIARLLAFILISICFYGFSIFSPTNFESPIENSSIRGNPRPSDIHSPIYIDGNTALDTFCTGNLTDGLDASSAHIIKDYIFNTIDIHACVFRNVNRFVIIRNCTFLSNNDNLASTNAGLYFQNASNIIIENCSFQRNPYGIYAFGAQNINITQNIFLNSSQSIYIENANNSLIQQNILNHTILRLIAVFSNFNLTVFNNTCANFSDGLFIMSTNQSLITNNTFTKGMNFDISTMQDYNLTIVNNTMERGLNFAVSENLLEETTSHVIENNTINSQSLYYYADQQGLNSANFTNAGQIILTNCSDSEIIGLVLANGMNAIRLCYSKNITIANNNMTNFIFAIDMTNATNNRIWNNTIKWGFCGISIYQCSENNNITQNIFTNASYGVQLSSNNNSFVQNVIENQSVEGIFIESGEMNNFTLNLIRNNSVAQAWDNGKNNWNTSTEGNYWGDYEMRYPLATNDGIVWNTPYTILGTGSSQDKHPYVIPIPLSINHLADFSVEINTTQSIPWILADNTFLNPWLVLIRNGTEILNKTWISGVNLNIYVNVSTLGTFNFTIIASDGMGNFVEDQINITAFNKPPILTNQPSNVDYECNSTGHFINWNVNDNSTKDSTYTIFRNGTELINSTWQSVALISWNVDGLAIGNYNYTLIAFDGYNESLQNELILTISNRNPTIVSIPNDMSFECNTTSNAISWNITDISWTDLTYRIYQNGVFLKTATWNIEIPFMFNIDNLEPGSYIFNMIAYDGYGGQKNDTVLVTVFNLPPAFVSLPVNQTYAQGTTGHLLIWQITDISRKNASYFLYRDGILIASQSWTPFMNITINIDRLAVGSYNYTIVILDGWGQSIRQTVWVTVESNTQLYWYLLLGLPAIFGIILWQKLKGKKIG